MVLQGFLNVLQPMTLLLVILGTAWGLTAGALPGLSASMAVILMLPFTYGMEAIQSVVVLVSVYVGAMCGGSISAILLKTPGTPSSVATTFDGYPMAMRGEAPKALGLSITASSFGGIFSGLIMVVCAPILATWAMKFQSAEFFALALQVNFARPVEGQHIYMPHGFNFLFMQNAVEKFLRRTGQRQVFVAVLSVVDDEHGQGNLVLLRRVLARHGGELSVRLVQRIRYFVQRKVARSAHGFDEVG